MKNPEWAIDLNENIMPKKLGKKVHWKDSAQVPYDGGDYEGPGKKNVHQQYRTCLSENTIMTLFRDFDDLSKVMTFRDYYERWTMVEVLEFFIARMDSLPYEIPRSRNKNRTSFDQRHQGTDILKAALKSAVTASNNKPAGTDELRMKDLYLDTYYKNYQKNYLDAIWDHMKQFQEKMVWICLPFLQFPKVADARYPRPIDADLRLHLDGDDTGVNQFLGVGDWDYHDFLFYSTNDDILALKHKNARYFAFCKAFIGREKVYERYEREQAGHPQAAWTGRDCFDAWPTAEGGGNGYKCGCNAGVRTCVLSNDPRDYCVNGGASCPTC
jgi:hypothetical protein